MIRRKHPHLEESIEMLRSKNLRKFTDVFSADDERIVAALRFIYRPVEDVNNEQKLYRSYLVVQSIQFGGPVYVPTLFIESYEPDANRLTLGVDLETVKEEVWNREPDFAVRGLAVPEELPAI